jgi:hypothetical protein
MTRYEPDELPGCSTPHNQYSGRERFRQTGARLRLFSAAGPIGYHSLYGVPSNCDTRGEFECTLTIPVLD